MKHARLAVCGLAAALGLGVAAPRAAAGPVLDASVFAGVDQDVTAIGRAFAGGMWVLGRFAPEAHLGFDGFLRLNGDAGVAARSFTLLDLGVRYAFTSDRFTGPFASVGGSFGLFTGKPHERKISDEPEVCMSAPGSPDDCAFRIDKNAALRFGLGYGFASSDNATVAVRLDVNYWVFSVNDFEDQAPGAPVPRDIPRPQDTVSVMLGLEFMRWP